MLTYPISLPSPVDAQTGDAQTGGTGADEPANGEPS